MHAMVHSLQRLDVSNVELIYNSSVFKSLATGGNVSEALVSNSTHKQLHVILMYNLYWNISAGSIISVGCVTLHTRRVNICPIRILVVIMYSVQLLASFNCCSIHKGR